MRTRPQSSSRFDCVYYDENNSLVLYTNPGIDHDVLSDNFKSYKDECKKLLKPLIEYLESKLDDVSKGTLLWSKIERNHPANRLLNLTSYLKADARIGFGRAPLPPYAIEVDEPITVNDLSMLLSQATNCSNDIALRVIQLVNASKENYFSSDIQSITDQRRNAFLPGIRPVKSFDELSWTLQHYLLSIEQQVNRHVAVNNNL